MRVSMDKRTVNRMAQIAAIVLIAVLVLSMILVALAG